MVVSYRVLYLPLEIKARELLPKVWLASRAVDRGWLVILGDYKKIRNYALEQARGVHVEISIPERKAHLQRQLKDHGHCVVNLCEESVIYANGFDYCLRKVGGNALAATDLVFAPGDVNASHIKERFPEHADRIKVTGHPRFDVLRPELRSVFEEGARSITRKYPNYILANTNFGRANPFKECSDYVGRLVSKGVIQQGPHEQFHRRMTDLKIRQFKAFRVLLANMALKTTVVLRPHPSENHEDWKCWASSFGIQVEYAFDSNVWIQGASAVLHPGCTTGVESVLLNKPTMSFIDEPNNEFLNVSDMVSHPVRNVTDVCSVLNNPPLLTPHQRAVLKRHVINVDLPFAADQILDRLDELDVAEINTPLGLTTVDQNVSKVSLLKKQKFPGLCEADILIPLVIWSKCGMITSFPQIRDLGNEMYELSHG